MGDLDVRLIAPSFSSYVDAGPPTPGQLADRARGNARKYPHVHLKFSHDIGRVDLLDMRSNLFCSVVEYRRSEPFKDWDDFRIWYNQLPYQSPLDPSEPIEAFGITGIRSTGAEVPKFGGGRIRKESYFFLGEHGIVLGINFVVTRYTEDIPQKEAARMQALVDELKNGFSVRRVNPAIPSH